MMQYTVLSCRVEHCVKTILNQWCTNTVWMVCSWISKGMRPIVGRAFTIMVMVVASIRLTVVNFCQVLISFFPIQYWKTTLYLWGYLFCTFCRSRLALTIWFIQYSLFWLMSVRRRSKFTTVWLSSIPSWSNLPPVWEGERERGREGERKGEREGGRVGRVGRERREILKVNMHRNQG